VLNNKEGTQKSYLDVFKEHNGFVSNKWIHYFFIYDQLFSRFIGEGEPITLLEIGVQNGGSLEIWKKYLPPNSKIWGIDIDKKCCALKFSENISFHLGNAADSDFVSRTFKDIKFDVIIDDGSHISTEVITAFIHMFPNVKPGGMYIIEDLHTSYWKSYGGGLKKRGSSIEFFKELIDVLNFDYLEKDRKSGKLRNVFKDYYTTVSSVSFFDSVLAINKYYKPKQTGFQSVYTGQIEMVADTSPYVSKLEEQHELIETVKEIFYR
jgi:ubiquinone/menaquinone biosynthesis C-methylase UbiE